MSFSLFYSPRAVRRGLPAAGALACLAGVLLLGSAAASAAELIGHVKNADGSTTVTRDGAPKPLAAGDNLYQGDAISTGKDSTLGVTLRDDTTIALGPSSALTLDEVLFDPAAEKVGMGVRLAQGTFSFLSGQIPKLAPDKTKISTPVATIGIRGTRFLVEVNSHE